MHTHDMNTHGTLYILATPIGNLGDITLRAIETFKKADMVLCEDTRVTGKLLSHLGIKKPMKSYTSHSSDKLHAEILESLKHEWNVVLVSDAGTPGISDPGMMLVKKVREEVPEASIVAIPGPSALVSALSISGISASEFTFLGFLPHKKGRETALRKIAEMEHPVVMYESTHRILKLLEELHKWIGTRNVGIAKEITKMHEGYFQGTPEELLSFFDAHKDKTKGEFVVIVDAKK
jgi:16S rRNA (cytidine1402-2'-O)-methyltransferase